MKKILLAAIAAMIMIFAGCKSGGGDPKTVLSEFFAALSKKDMASARNLATAESKTLLDMMEMAMKTDAKETDKFDLTKMEFGEAKIEGDKATVPVKETTSGETLNYSLKKEGGSWKVAFDKNSMMSMGMDKMKEQGVNVSDSIGNVLDELKKLDNDSLKEKMMEGMKALDSAGIKIKELQK